MKAKKISGQEKRRRLIQSGAVSYGGSIGEEVKFIKNKKLGGYEVQSLNKDKPNE